MKVVKISKYKSTIKNKIRNLSQNSSIIKNGHKDFQNRSRVEQIVLTATYRAFRKFNEYRGYPVFSADTPFREYMSFRARFIESCKKVFGMK